VSTFASRAAAVSAARQRSLKQHGAAWTPRTGDLGARGRPLEPLDLDAAAERYAVVIRRVASDNRIRKRSARRRFMEMLKFLDVCAQATQTVSPPPRVDDGWHAFILFTRDYAAYCEDRFGRFIHHDPMESQDTVAYERAYSAAMDLFGELDRRIWPQPGRMPVRRGRGFRGVGGGGWFDGGFLGCGSGCGGGCGGGGC